MSGKSTIGRRASVQVIVAGQRLKADEKAQDRYRALVVSTGFVVLATLGFLLARPTDYRTPSHTTNGESDAGLFTGTITSYPDDKRACRERFFDNKTGRMTQPEPCGLRARNLRALKGNGAQIPSNSIDAIRKSFLSR
jgi:hypothetical protein